MTILSENKMKILLLILFALPTFLFGDVQPDNQTQSLLDTFSTSSALWRDGIIPAARYLFYTLTLIDLVLEFGMLAIKEGLTFDTVIAALVKRVLLIGFFLLLFDNPAWLKAIASSFLELGTRAGGVNIDVDNVFKYGIDVVNKLWDGISLFKVGDSLALVFAGLILIVCFALMAAQMAVTMVKMYGLLAVAPLVFSLVGLSHTRSLAYNPIIAIIKVGMELLFIKLYLALTLTKITDFSTNVGTDNFSVLTVVGVSVLMVCIVQMIPGMVSSILDGSLGGNSTAGVGVASSVAGGMLGGMLGGAGAGMAVREASNLAKMQRDGGDSGASTFKNLKSAAGEAVQKKMAGQANRGGTVGGVMAESMRGAQESIKSGFGVSNQKSLNEDAFSMK